MRQSIRPFWLCVLVFLLAFSALSFAKDGDRVQFGKTISVEQDESAGDLVCIGCSIHMDGTCGDVVAIGGSITVNGEVKGDIVAVGGAVHLEESASVSGDVVTVGGRLYRHPNAEVRGNVSSQSGIPVFIALVVVPLFPVILIVAFVVWLVSRNRRPAPVRI